MIRKTRRNSPSYKIQNTLRYEYIRLCPLAQRSKISGCKGLTVTQRYFIYCSASQTFSHVTMAEQVLNLRAEGRCHVRGAATKFPE
jgi:hypothetical protein